MKVLRVIASMDPRSGGPCQGIRNSVMELEKLGVHNEVVTLDDPTASFLGKDSFQIYAIGPSKNPWRYSPKLMSWLLDNFARFDVVIVHGLWLYHSYAVSKAIRIYRSQDINRKQGKNPKLFIMPHGMLDPYFQRVPERKMKALRNWVYWKLIEGKVIHRAEGILFTCEAELQLAREPFSPYQPKQEINVGYGIEAPPAYTPDMREAFLQRYPALTERPYFLFLSRIHEKKGVDLLIKAYGEIITKIEIKDTKNSISVVESKTPRLQNNELPHLVIAGPGLETSYGKKLQQSVLENPSLQNLVVFPGMLTGEAKWGAFYGCEAFVLPSHQENFGIAVVEALACGKPVLISNQVNIWQEIQASGGGLVADDSQEGTANLLNLWLYLSIEEKQAMNIKAKNCYEKYFAIKPHVLKLFEVFKNLK